MEKEVVGDVVHIFVVGEVAKNSVSTHKMDIEGASAECAMSSAQSFSYRFSKFRDRVPAVTPSC